MVPLPVAPALPRLLDLNALLQRKSHFLFGPRQTGKTTLIRETLRAPYVFNLLESDLFLTFQRSPERLREVVKQPGALVVIDEIQKVPALLDEVQWLIEERKNRFLLTGSSARKLRRGGVNLLGGRARSRTLHPLVAAELGEFDLRRVLSYGSLPSVYFSDQPAEDLRAYASDYLQQEVAYEGLTRNLPAFGRFLEVAALCNGHILNLTQIASDAQVPRTTVHEYLQILHDTLLGFDVPSYRKAKTRKPLATSKFYFFDVVVARALAGQTHLLPEKSTEFGLALEAWMFHELRTWVDYQGAGSVHYWRTTSGHEVDFVLNESIAVEVKAGGHITERDLQGLRTCLEETDVQRAYCVCRERFARKVGAIEVLPYSQFLQRLWADDLGITT